MQSRLAHPVVDDRSRLHDDPGLRRRLPNPDGESVSSQPTGWVPTLPTAPENPPTSSSADRRKPMAQPIGFLMSA